MTVQLRSNAQCFLTPPANISVSFSHSRPDILLGCFFPTSVRCSCREKKEERIPTHTPTFRHTYTRTHIYIYTHSYKQKPLLSICLTDRWAVRAGLSGDILMSLSLSISLSSRLDWAIGLSAFNTSVAQLAAISVYIALLTSPGCIMY